MWIFFVVQKIIITDPWLNHLVDSEVCHIFYISYTYQHYYTTKNSVKSKEGRNMRFFNNNLMKSVCNSWLVRKRQVNLFWQVDHHQCFVLTEFFLYTQNYFLNKFYKLSWLSNFLQSEVLDISSIAGSGGKIIGLVPIFISRKKISFVIWF